MEIVHSCRSHAWRYMTSAEVIHIYILDSFRSRTLNYLTNAGVMHSVMQDLLVCACAVHCIDGTLCNRLSHAHP